MTTAGFTTITTVSFHVPPLLSVIVTSNVYVPAMRLLTVGLAALIFEIAALVEGHESCFHAYPATVPSGSTDALASKDTVLVGNVIV